jgi:hypothetical protein
VATATSDRRTASARLRSATTPTVRSGRLIRPAPAVGEGLIRGYASNLAGVLYAAATLWIAGALGGGPAVPALVVGGCMFLVGLHTAVPLLSFTAGGFFGYATAFSVHAAGRTVLFSGLAEETAATAIAMLIGAAVGIATDVAGDRLARE